MNPELGTRHLHAPLIDHVHASMLAHAPSGGRVLDVGCGAGRVMRRVAGATLRVGVDIHPIPEAWRDAAFAKADMAHLPVRGSAFDTVICLFVFPPAGGRGRTAGLRELARTARPGATLLFSCQNMFSPVLLARRAYYLLRYGAKPTNAILSPRGIERRLSAAGWRITARLGLSVPPYRRTRGVVGALARAYHRWVSSRPRWAPILGIVATRREERQP